MNENDNNENHEIESEIVDSELVESEVVQATNEPVVIKKRSFLSFLAFVMSLAALSLSVYMYYLEHYKEQKLEKTTSWQAALSQSESDASRKVLLLEQQLKQIEVNNIQLSAQIKTLGDNSQQVIGKESNDLTPVQSVEPFDDSALTQQVLNLEGALAEQNNRIQQLQSNLNNNNTQTSQSLQLLSSDIKNKLATHSTNLPQITQANNTKSIVGSLLQEAYVQLNIKGNIAKSQTLISQVVKQLSQLTGMRYGYLSSDLESFSQEISEIEQVDSQAITTQIDRMSQAVSQIPFISDQQVQDSEKESSWYDNLITIKKIDESSQPILSKSEKITIINVISNHFHMLKIALMSKNKQLWNSEIEQIQELLKQHYAGNAEYINDELLELKRLNINLEIPSMEKYLQQFKSINLANENE
jgi:uncharacterized protein HemX